MERQRRPFRREGEVQRREALVAAALDCVADGGPARATVRAIAERAGVSPGLIRHYFNGKEDLLSVAYASLMNRMTRDAGRILEIAPSSAVERLGAFVGASVSAPVADPRAMSLWAGFINQMLNDDGMRAEHAKSYLEFRDRLEGLIDEALAEAGLPRDPCKLRRSAIAGNALIDGLWLEASALPEAFAPGEMALIARAGLGAMLGLDLGQGPLSALQQSDFYAPPPPRTDRGDA